MKHGAISSQAVATERKPHPHGQIAALLVLAAVLIAGGVVVGLHAQKPLRSSSDTGARIIAQGSMSEDEARTMLDEMAASSRITVSLAPEMLLTDDGSLRVNLVVAEDNAGLSERLEVEQEGEVVYSSGVVEPGYTLEWGHASQAHPGEALATVYAVRDGADYGNPISVDVQVVKE